MLHIVTDNRNVIDTIFILSVYEMMYVNYHDKCDWSR